MERETGLELGMIEETPCEVAGADAAGTAAVKRMAQAPPTRGPRRVAPAPGEVDMDRLLHTAGRALWLGGHGGGQGEMGDLLLGLTQALEREGIEASFFQCFVHIMASNGPGVVGGNVLYFLVVGQALYDWVGWVTTDKYGQPTIKDAAGRRIVRRWLGGERAQEHRKAIAPMAIETIARCVRAEKIQRSGEVLDETTTPSELGRDTGRL